MSTTETDIKIDLDALDAAKNSPISKNNGQNDAKTAKSDADKAAGTEITVERADADPKPAVLTPDEGLEKLKKQLEDEKSARITAERHAADAAESERQAKTEVQGTQLDLVTSAITTVTQLNDALESQYATALAAQDFAAAAKINREMSANSAKLLQLENGKAALEKAPKPQLRAPVDPVEQFVSRLTPQSASWVRAHPEFVRDAAKNRKMFAAHEMAMADGLQADTPAYFAAIEDTLKIRAADPVVEHTDDPTSEAAAPVRRPPPAAAPVTRAGTSNGKRANVVTLTPAEVEIAEMMKMTPQEYAVQKSALIKEGKLN